MKLVEPARSSVRSRLLLEGFAEATMPVAAVTLQESTAPAVFTAAAGTEAAYVEKDGLAGLRMGLTGTRFAVLFPICPTWDYFTKGAAAPAAAGGVAPKPAGADALSKLHSGLLNLSREAFADIARRFPVFFSTLGPGDLVYTPPGFVTVESVHGKIGKDVDADVTARNARTPPARPHVRVCACCCALR